MTKTEAQTIFAQMDRLTQLDARNRFHRLRKTDMDREWMDIDCDEAFIKSIEDALNHAK